ncbi:MAG TPA: HAD-IIIA family hydrolase [Syntrophomonadaceae bacterium]|nr:HAD-IIIA family hydrolase [Syntrophomonadaceae bacterium]
MAGGKGTRLFSITRDLIPKPMAKLADKPIIEHAVECMVKNDIIDITIIVGHLGELIEQYVGQGDRWGVNIKYIYEQSPLGTAGALYYLRDSIKDNFALIYADILLDVDLNRMLAFHISKDAEATLLVHPNSHPFDSDLVILSDDLQVMAFDYKGNVREYDYDNCVNSGVFIFSPQFLTRINAPEKIDLEKQLLRGMVENNEAIYGYYSPEYIKDVGTPERLQIAEEEYLKGIVAAKNLKIKQKCVFIDRDGTINVYHGLIVTPEEIELLPGVAQAIRKLNQSGYLTIIATNQPVIARGICTIEELKGINKRIKTLLGKEGAYIDDLVFCPHHPDRGYPEEVEEYKIDCDCRKPKIGMLTRCAECYNIDLSSSWYIGDTYRDVMTGKNAGTGTILVCTGEKDGGKKFDVVPDYFKDSLLDAVELILNP